MAATVGKRTPTSRRFHLPRFVEKLSFTFSIL